MRFLRAGRAGVLVEVDDLDAVMSLNEAIRREPLDGVIDVIPAARTVLLTFDGSTSHDRVIERLGALSLSAVAPTSGDQVEVPVSYDGEDLATVAGQTGLSEAGVVERHLAGEYVVAFTGFAPGFAYLTGGDAALRVPRRDTPRTNVPAGSVALAGEFTGVYPREGPGGWQLIGRTDATLWDLGRDPPALLPPGTPVRFVRSD